MNTSSQTFTIAAIKEHAIEMWDTEKLQRLKSLIEAEIVKRLITRKPAGAYRRKGGNFNETIQS